MKFPQPAPSFDEPLEMLEACHERIASQLATLERLVPYVAAHGADPAARDAARAVMRYFDTAGVNHHLDEEEDLFPALRASKACDPALLELLLGEHRDMLRAYEGLRRRLLEIGEGNGASLDKAEVDAFAAAYRRHIEREEAQLLPAAREALDAPVRRALGLSMGARRKSPGLSRPG